MNDSKDNPKPLPPDDFSATTPNIKVPKQNLPNYQNDSVNDWEKTNYNYSAKDMPQEENWKKTSYNNAPPAQNPHDFNKTFMPNQPSNNPPKGDEWGMTQANIDLPYDNQSNQKVPPANQENYGSKQDDYGKTTPFINLPQNERAKFEIPPPSSSAVSVPGINLEEVQKVEETKEVKKGVPTWMWAGGGMLLMFFFAVAVLLGVYYLFLGKTGFDIALKSVPKNSDVYVNGSVWGVTSSDDTVRLQGLKAREIKLIQIKNPNATCQDIKDVIGEDGKMQTINVQCAVTTQPTPPVTSGGDIPDDCKVIKNGEFAKSRKCANDALDKIGDKDFTVQQLLDAMNLYIVNFAKNDFTIRAEDKPFLQRAAGFIKRLEKSSPGVNIQVGGHTDSDGTDAKNEPLSKNRATAVRDALVGFGVTPTMLEVQGYGSKVPKPGNENRNEDEKFQNRRIEYKAILK